MPEGVIRLAKRVADMLGCSRREAELYIEGGWVTVDGAGVEAPQARVAPTQDVALLPGAKPHRVIADTSAALDVFLDPLKGGPTGRGWPFGRDVYRSEILEVIDRTPGVDHVEDLELVAAAGHSTACHLWQDIVSSAPPASAAAPEFPPGLQRLFRAFDAGVER